MSPKDDWRDHIAMDLDVPKFKTTYSEAVLFRLRNNYLWLYGINLVTWIVKLCVHPQDAESLGEVVRRAAVGPIPPYVVLGEVRRVFKRSVDGGV